MQLLSSLDITHFSDPDFLNEDFSCYGRGSPFFFKKSFYYLLFCMPYKVFDQGKTILSIGLLTSSTLFAIHLPDSTNATKSAEKESIQNPIFDRILLTPSSQLYSLSHGCQTHGVALLSHDIVWLFSPSQAEGAWLVHDASGLRVGSLTPLHWDMPLV